MNNDRTEMVNKFNNNSLMGKRPKRIGETRRRKVSSLGAVVISNKLAGKNVFVKDNLDGTFTVIVE